ncbi:hypothetical protein ACF06X_16980 [Streptomyces sp. NPDC015346]|uniref:hypothetical protein n=1 Tax=Streptomyces sp. NPDC015346 TaxID=3364954 RepID=UPI00370351CC
MTLHSGWLTPSGQTRVATRHTALGATLTTGPLSSRSGILPGTTDGKYRVGGLWMSSTGPMTATVYTGRAVIQGTNAEGAYPVALDQDTSITFADGDPLNPRIDLVVLRVYDNDVESPGRHEAVVEIVRGQPKAAPEKPAVPPRSLALFSVKVKAGASAGTGGIDWSAGASTDLRVTTVGVGGILPVYNNGADFGSYPGQYRDNDNAHVLQRWSGTEWVPYPKEVGGIAPSGVLTAGSYIGQFREANGVLQRWNGSVWATYHPPVEVESATTGAIALPGWTVVSFSGRRTRGIAHVLLSVTRNGATITATNAGHIPDEPLCTLPAGWRPAIDYEASASDGIGSGSGNFWTNGQVNLRTWSPNGTLEAGRHVRLSATYILP